MKKRSGYYIVKGTNIELPDVYELELHTDGTYRLTYGGFDKEGTFGSRRWAPWSDDKDDEEVTVSSVEYLGV